MSLPATATPHIPRRSSDRFDSGIITGALLWEDSKVISGLLVSGQSPATIRAEVATNNSLLRHSEKRALNVASYLLQRFKTSPHKLIALISHSDSTTSKQAAFIASVLASRFLRDFMNEVVCEAFEKHGRRLPTDFWIDFWATCVSKEPALAELRVKAVSEIRSTLLKFLTEVGILEGIRSRELQRITFTTPILSALKTQELVGVQFYLRSFVR